MRKNESETVVRMFHDLGLDSHLHFVDASADFLAALEGEVDPEKKRRIIGNTFIEVFHREAKRLGIERYLLGQGTIYPDTIETGGTKRADVIKTHHNRVPLIGKMIAEGRVVEPLVDLYKVEVRELGERLGVPHNLIWRHPFPGPGLGVRLLCSREGETGPSSPDADRQVAEIASRFRLDGRILPIRSVGVKADVRVYEHPVMLSGKSTWDRAIEAAGTILKEAPGVNRCIWNLGSNLSQEIHTVGATVTRERLDLLREADDIVMSGLTRHGIYDSIWQCPTVLAPLQVDGRGTELCIIRPVHSERAMTASPARLPEALAGELNESISALPGISGVAVDLTSKPPGTIEWE
jgi:GMP synthase (glutamine-hydrolysing)